MTIKYRSNLDGCSSDEALILATGRGDLQAFAEVVRRHEEWAWRVAHRFLGDDQEAADMPMVSCLGPWASKNRTQG